MKPTDRRTPQISKYIAAFAITTLIFILGIFVGSLTDNAKLSSLDKLEQEIKMNTMGTEIQYILMTESPCNYVNSTEMAMELGTLGARLTYMENQLGADDPRVIDLKEYYSLLQLRHWLFLKEAKKECKKDFNLVLYFYSNAGDCKNCGEQGEVLTYVHEKENIFNIYAFDVNIDNPALNTLKERYHITTTPTLVIGDTVYEGFTPRQTIAQALNISIN